MGFEEDSGSEGHAVFCGSGIYIFLLQAYIKIVTSMLMHDASLLFSRELAPELSSPILSSLVAPRRICCYNPT